MDYIIKFVFFNCELQMEIAMTEEKKGGKKKTQE